MINKLDGGRQEAVDGYASASVFQSIWWGFQKLGVWMEFPVLSHGLQMQHWTLLEAAPLKFRPYGAIQICLLLLLLLSVKHPLQSLPWGSFLKLLRF